jgi:Membrane-bound lysozyme-inhibitor of c-type lysozyme
VILPIKHESIIFANITSVSGTRYTAQQFIWWEAAGRSIMLSSGLFAGKNWKSMSNSKRIFIERDYRTIQEDVSPNFFVLWCQVPRIRKTR